MTYPPRYAAQCTGLMHENYNRGSTVLITTFSIFRARSLPKKDAMMVRSNGAWVQLRNFIEPAVAEARARKELLSRRRRANQHLFDREARQEPPATFRGLSYLSCQRPLQLVSSRAGAKHFVERPGAIGSVIRCKQTLFIRHKSPHSLTNPRVELVRRWEHVYDEESGKLRYYDPKTGAVHYLPANGV